MTSVRLSLCFVWVERANKIVNNFSRIYRIAAKFGLVSLRDFVRFTDYVMG